MSYQTNYILLTIDVEDWFQVENFKQYIPFDSWSSYELRVEKNTHRILDLLDSIGIENTEYDSQKAASNGQGLSTDLCNASETGEANSGRRRVEVSQFPDETEKEKISGKSSKSCLTTPKATFFVLGWLAERLPHLVREIHSRGHEIASHGYYHNLCNEQSHEDLKTDLCDSKSLLEDIIGNQVYGYRAPSFAINNDILKIIEDCGYLYDSSYNSFALHSRYGHLDLSRNGQKGIALQIADPRFQTPEPETRNPKPRTFYELPISNLKFAHQVFPWGGGGYFRMIPFPLFRCGVKSILKKEKAYLFYMHPWEIDPQQPRVNEVSTFFRFRHYINLKKTHSKLSKLITEFCHCRFTSCKQYLSQIF